MEKLKLFEKGERVCFVGDSITEGTTWITHIADYYSKARPQDKVDIFPCGVGGGTCLSAMLYMREQTEIWSPTTVVIMLGMNDIDRAHYNDNQTEENVAAAEYALKKYEMNLHALSEMLKYWVKVNRIIYLAPTPYDELQVSETPIQTGCWKALRKCADIMKRYAEEFGGEFYDFGGEFYELLKESYEKNSKNALIMPDRVHPNDFGYSVMARVFLNAQGFSDVAVNADMICDGSAELKFSPAAQKYFDNARTLQTRWELEWLLSRYFDSRTDEGKRDFCENFERDHPNCTIDEAYWAANYWRYRDGEKENINGIKEAIEEM